MSHNIYVAADGNYGSADYMIIVPTDNWTDDDWAELDNATDIERIETAMKIIAWSKENK